MYGKPAMISFKYQVFLYGSETITYLNAICTLIGYRAITKSHQTAPPPTSGCHPPLCMAA
jgi:hypothetical protein